MSNFNSKGNRAPSPFKNPGESPKNLEKISELKSRSNFNSSPMKTPIGDNTPNSCLCDHDPDGKIFFVTNSS